MEEIKRFLNKILPAISLGIFAIWSLSIIFFSSVNPGEAEAHAWTIAGNTNIIQLIDLMKVEGHFLIWFLCIMPFAKFPNLYPYAMDIVNWLFCFGAVFYMWKKAPFNNFIKLCITFSVPFLQIYAVYPRCYSVGILFLFLAAGVYKERFEHPFKYLIYLVLAANTSLPACIGASFLGILFIFDTVRQKNNKKLNIFILAVIVLNSILFYLQFHGVSIPDYEASREVIVPSYIQAYYGQIGNLTVIEKIKIFLLWLGTIVFPYMFRKNKRVLFFFILSEITTLLFFTFVYGARLYHTCFLFIFAIISFWIYKSENNKENEKYGWKSIVFSILAINMFFIDAMHLPAPLDFLIEPVTYDSEMMSGNIYSNFAPITLSVLLPHLAKQGQTIYDMEGRDLNSYEALKLYFKKSAKTMAPDSFAQNLDPKKNNFIILNGIFKDNYIQGEKYKFDIELYKTYYNLEKTDIANIYKIKNITLMTKN